MLINAERADGVCSGSVRSSHSLCSDSALSTKQSSLIKAVSELVCSDQGGGGGGGYWGLFITEIIAFP